MAKSSKSKRRPSSKPQRRKRSIQLSEVRLDALIREAIVDCYDDAEQAMGLFTMIEENLKLPFETKILGIPVDVVSVDLRGNDHITAICEREGERQAISLLDLPLPTPAPEGAEWIRGFAAFLRVDEDLIAAAAQQSDDEGTGPASSEELLRMIHSLGQRRKDELLLQVMEGKGQEVKRTLLNDFRQRCSPGSGGSPASRSVKELLSVAEALTSERRREAAARAAKEQRRREREQEVAKAKRLEKLSKKQAAAWRQVETLIGTKQPKKYDEAVNLLRDLQDLSVKKGKQQNFASRIEDLRQRHGRKLSLLERLDRARLGCHN